MNPYIILATLALAASTGFGVAWKWQAANITEIELAHAQQTLSLELEARDDAERHIKQIKTAQARATTALQRVATERAGADSAGNGLRLTTASAVQAAAQDTTACPARAAALGVVFDQCVAEYLKVAELADRHAADAIEQHEAAQ